MAARLQLKLGLVAEHDRLDDSPDTLVVVEPSVGSVARSKGHLYLLVTSRVSSRHALEATRLVAETIRNEYYYDESAGIRVCLKKAIATANKRLIHQADRLGLRSADGNGPIGIGVAVVRGNEMYVATVGPAEAYLIRQARLSTLPDPHRERGLPSSGLEPDVWRGEISVGDSLALVSPNIMAKLGPDELKDAMITLHPQSAMEHLHARFVAAEGSGSDGAIAFEATEVAQTSRGRTLVPVRPAEPPRGRARPFPDPTRGQRPGCIGSRHERRRVGEGGCRRRARGLVRRVQDLLPHRRPAYRRVTPLASRRETQRRAAVALLALIAVVGGLGLAVYSFGGTGQQEAISSVTAGEAALRSARDTIAEVSGPGIDLVEDDPAKALELLTKAYQDLDRAEDAKVAASVIDPLRAKVVTGLDRLYGVVPVASTDLFTFVPEADAPKFDLTTLVLGPDGAPYVIDAATKTVYRVDLKRQKATAVVSAGKKAAGTTVADPKFLAVGGRDLLILDSKNVLWRWRAANDAGKGTLTKVTVNGASQWGDDITAIGTFLRDGSRNLYNLYVVDPSEQQIRAYPPASDGGGFPSKATGWLATARAVNEMTSMYIDGDVFITEGGALERFVRGKSDGWEPGAPEDTLLRPAPDLTLVTGAGDHRTGDVYAFDARNQRVIAYDKASGEYRAQYRLAGGARDWADLRALYVIPGADAEAPPTLVWLGKDHIGQAVLEAVADSPSATPRPSASAGPKSSAKASAKPDASGADEPSENP